MRFPLHFFVSIGFFLPLCSLFAEEYIAKDYERAHWKDILDIVAMPIEHQSGLELLDYQKEEIQRILNEYRATTGNARRDFKDLDDVERNKRVSEIRSQAKREAEKKLSEILLDHQLARIRQLALLHRKKSHGILAVLQSHDVSPQIHELRISTEQMRKLVDIYEKSQDDQKKKEHELIKEFQRARIAMRAEFEERVLSVLTPEQRAKMKELIGEESSTAEVPIPHP